MGALNWFIGPFFSWSLDMKGWMISYPPPGDIAVR